MLPFVSGRQLAADIQAKRVSSVEATEFYINRIETLDTVMILYRFCEYSG